MCYPPSLEEHILVCWLSILVWFSWVMMLLLYHWWMSLFGWVGAFHVKEADYFILHSNMGVTYPFHSPHFVWPCLPWPSSMIVCIPLWVHYPPASTGRHHSLCLTYMFLPKFAAKSLYLWSSPVLGWHSGRHPKEKPQLPVFSPQGSFIGKSFGDCLTTFLLWCPLFFHVL